ncbi:unnamed protein product [Parascedosporium putredinis]|uniref:Mannosyl-oligosaccharide glucosidase n=1 Tax=Parascedosporium putredinis TaxID=1442378 RepID=A0A9P1GZ68_9PEZI|nr:unnamed protein product [Parascedosporium putredinis]CAI7990581.1 unnamed protein product [Parascedosporium putredinis]
MSAHHNGDDFLTKEEQRLKEDRERTKFWKKWGPYVPERQWGTGEFAARAPRGGELERKLEKKLFAGDRILTEAWESSSRGLQRQWRCLGSQISLMTTPNPAPIAGAKTVSLERLFGLSNPQGNHGESVKEAHFHLDNVPHSYMKFLYKYPQKKFPYQQLIDENAKRGKDEREYQLYDTGIFEEDRYWDIFIETAKEENDPDELLFRVTAWNRGPDPAPSTSSLTFGSPPQTRRPLRPLVALPGVGSSGNDVLPEMLFTENDTNFELLYEGKNKVPYVKDAFHRHVVGKEKGAINPAQKGTKCAAWYQFTDDGGVLPGECAVVRFRLTKRTDSFLDEEEFDNIIDARKDEADEFYYKISPLPISDDLRNIQRQAFSGMIHMHADDILSMPDSWEYPFFAVWDTAFHCITLAMIDPDFAKKQLDLFTREWYCHPNGQLPAYEWDYEDVNPPVHAWATFRVFKMERKMYGRQDLDFLERVFQKLLMNFTWWVNRKDMEGKNLFEGGFLGLDNIGIFNRSEPLPTGGTLEQADSTGWMAFYCLCMLNIALELAKYRRTYEDIASKFFEHFIFISDAMTFRTGEKDEKSLWNEEDGFYYDAISWGGPHNQQLPVRSLVGLIPLYATLTLEPELINKLPSFKRRVDWFTKNRCDIAERNMASIRKRGKGNRVLLAMHGIRSLSKHHEKNPFQMNVNGQEFKVSYVPGDSDSGVFGGNSNWRGPIWLCVECPTGSGDYMHLGHVSEELQHRLQHLFTRNDEGRRSMNGGNDLYDFDPHWKDYLWFYELFDGDSGRGLGATHQCGWTGLIARMIHDTGMSCRLPQTPRTPSVGLDYYFDEVFRRHTLNYSKPPRLRRASTARSMGVRSDFYDQSDAQSAVGLGIRDEDNDADDDDEDDDHRNGDGHNREVDPACTAMLRTSSSGIQERSTDTRGTDITHAAKSLKLPLDLGVYGLDLEEMQD